MHQLMQPAGNQGKAKVGAPATKDKKCMPPATSGKSAPAVMRSKPMAPNGTSTGKAYIEGL